MNIDQIISKRKIKEIVHFTSSNGFLGIVASKALKCRNQLKKDDFIEHILKLNTIKEFDPEWKDYVNLSISNINLTLFGISSKSWYTKEQWRILAFDPVILTHPRVKFVTTNNAYRDHLDRGEGPIALENLFAPVVKGVYGRPTKRGKQVLDCDCTDLQAEVLYPDALSTKYLRTIYVEDEEQENVVAAQIAAVQHPKIEIVIDPEKFGG